jgi:hypothetical protein
MDPKNWTKNFEAIDEHFRPDAETTGPFAPSFIVDRAAVWEKLAEILLTNDAFTVIKAAKKTQNG